ncbi:MAG TPA: amidohydrolase family protein [Micromonosporaceae bacterium]
MIDAHHHVWDLSVRDQPWLADEELAPIRRTFGLDDLRPSAAAAGVTGTVMVQTVTVPEETPEMLALTDPLVVGVVGWTELTAPGIADELARLRALPGGERLVGIRHQVQEEPDPDYLRRPDVLRGLRALAAAGLAYDLIVRPHQIPAATYAAALVPELRFVLDHAGKPLIAEGITEPWADDIRALAALPNASCKLSGLVTEAAPGAGPEALAPYVDVMLDAFTPDRLMFGSDWPVSLLMLPYGDVVRLSRELVAQLSDSEQAAIFGGTATRIYQLPQEA